jgi:hypothetical protein
MRLKLFGRVWAYNEVQRLPGTHLGECDGPHVKNKQIRIRNNLAPKKWLEILLHECLHGLFWHIDEEYISDGAKDLAESAWKLGVRPLAKYPDLLKEYDRRERGENG